MSHEYYDEKNKKILELETRRKIYELVKRYSGDHFRALERKSNLSVGVLKYHINFLTKHNFIRQEKDGNNTRYFIANIQHENRKLLGLLRQKNIRKIILCIFSNENCHHEDIVKYVNISPSTVSWYLKRLEREEIISYVKDGRKTTYSLRIDKEEIVKLLVTYKESFLDALVNKTVEMWEIR